MLRALVATLMIGLSIWVLSSARSGVEISQRLVGQTPVTEYAQAGADGPAVVIAHGFAGSQQMMQGYALPLARAGYRVAVFEFLGHGRHTQPMSGDVNAIEGTTRLLVSQVHAVMDAVTEGDAPVALLGHSMATDILVRAAQTRDDVGPMVLVSAFSQEIDGSAPADLLLITGAWEPGLRAFAVDALKMVDGSSAEGQTASDGQLERRAVIAPLSDHVSVLHSRTGRTEALDWLDRFYDRSSNVQILPTGWALLALFFGMVLAFRPFVALLPDRPRATVLLTAWQRLLLVLVPAITAPLVAVAVHPTFLPVLVADHLMLHLLLFGGLQLGFLRYWRVPLGGFSIAAFAIVLVWCIFFGFALDRYAANFWPTAGRLWIIAVIGIGAVPYMLADAILAAQSSFWQRLMFRLGFIGSLILAVVLDFEGLFFLIMIAPVMVLFYLIFGTVGRAAARVSGPLAPGLALGIVLAWALGVSFPLFQS